MSHKMLGVFKVVWRLSNQRVNDVCQLLCHLICNGSPPGHDEHKEGANFVYFGKAIKFWEDCTSGIPKQKPVFNKQIIALFQQPGVSLLWIQTKLVTYLAK